MEEKEKVSREKVLDTFFLFRVVVKVKMGNSCQIGERRRNAKNAGRGEGKGNV